MEGRLLGVPGSSPLPSSKRAACLSSSSPSTQVITTLMLPLTLEDHDHSFVFWLLSSGVTTVNHLPHLSPLSCFYSMTPKQHKSSAGLSVIPMSELKLTTRLPSVFMDLASGSTSQRTSGSKRPFMFWRPTFWICFWMKLEFIFKLFVLIYRPCLKRTKYWVRLLTVAHVNCLQCYVNCTAGSSTLI